MLDMLPGLFLLLLLGGLLFYVFLTLYIVWRMLFPPRMTYAWAISRGRAGEPGELTPPLDNDPWQADTRSGAIDLWDCAGAASRGPVVIFTHGWSDGRIRMLSRMAPLAQAASRLITWDMPRHGESTLRARFTLAAREHELLIDLIEAVRARHPDREIVLFGASMGSGLCLAAARGARVAGIVAEAPYVDPFTPARNALLEAGLPSRGALPVAIGLIGTLSGLGPRWRGFDRAEIASELTCPILVLHGDEDPICPLDHGRMIAEASPHSELVVIRGGTHKNLWHDPSHAQRCTEASVRFLGALRAG